MCPSHTGQVPMRPLFAFLILTVAFAASCSKSQELTPTQIEQLRSQFRAYLAETGAPSVAVGVAKEGEILWEEGFGYADKDRKTPASAFTMYSVGSISKPMTATAVMMLAERGLIDLNKPANAYLAEPGIRPYAGNAEDATVKRVLHHTAGLPMYWHFFDGEPARRPSPEQIEQHFGILTSPPGDRYEYSNLGYSLLATIVERVSGKDFPEFVQEEIFEPLGLSRTAIFVEPPEADSVALRYIGNKDVSRFYDYHLRGASAVYASVHDLLRFGMFHLKNRLADQKQIISRETIEAMQETTDPKLPRSRYRIGWDVGERYGYNVVTHGGGMPGVRAMLLLVPPENIAVAVVSNGETIVLPKVYDAVLAAILPDYADRLRKQQPGQDPGKPGPFVPPSTLIGEWCGKIVTYRESIPVELSCRSDGAIRLMLRPNTALAKDVADLAGVPRFQNGMFIVNFRTELPMEEAGRSPYTTYLKMKLSDATLSGFALAVCEKETFGLPSYIELTRKKTQ
jgi:CubicO group peptidase (beta-lactamase class C family)